MDTDGDTAAARDILTQLEQARWVLGGLLESKDLPSVWPIRVLLTSAEKTNPNGEFVWQNGQYLLVCPPGERVPLAQVGGILLDSNTPRLPSEVESGLRQLFGTLEAHGSRVTWGGPPPHPDLAWARMQLFATKFEYTLSFHIFLAALKSGSDLRAAEQNAFGKDSKALEQEAAANLASGNWQPVSVSGRPLDPKRDFGEHSVDPTVAAVYLADAELASDPKSAEAAYKSAVEAGGSAAALGFEGLARISELEKDNPKPFLDRAIRAGSKSAPVYVTAAEGLDPGDAVPLLKKAIQLNPLWAEPVFQQAQLTPDQAEKMSVLKQATRLDPRAPQYWIELAHVQTTQGLASAAQGSWLRAEDAAPTPEERDRVHQLRLDSERERLDAAEEARRNEREAVHLADERAQRSQSDRVSAAEAKANQALDSAAGGKKPENVVPWEQVVPQKKLEGTLIRVDCLGSYARLTIKNKTGESAQLLLANASEADLPCGPQQPARRVSVAYAAQPDDRFHTSGNITSLKIQ
ncbi:MAG: hypothetical protein JO145_02020 [Acidobacteriaceae bacterium]|nr:hypothetical protein [Acidobacteriaceae bacterium]